MLYTFINSIYNEECAMSKILFNDNWKFTLKEIGWTLSDIENLIDCHNTEITHAPHTNHVVNGAVILRRTRAFLTKPIFIPFRVI